MMVGAWKERSTDVSPHPSFDPQNLLADYTWVFIKQVNLQYNVL